MIFVTYGDLMSSNSLIFVSTEMSSSLTELSITRSLTCDLKLANHILIISWFAGMKTDFILIN